MVLLLHFMICHSKSAIDPAPQDVIKTTRWNNIRDAMVLVFLPMEPRWLRPGAPLVGPICNL
jgi:hypothetical protein